MQKAYSYVRFSTKIQEEGDSEKRQKESSEKYLKDHPELTLDTSLSMFDAGLSAFKGKHISQGALGVFLQLVEAGKVESGSVLLIENIDRLTRLKPMEALRYFDKIIHSGIKIVTLQSGMEFTESSLNENQGQLYVIVGEIQRAHAESERKSYNVGKAWETKRQQVINGKIKLTKRVPQWIDKNHELIPEVCEVIKIIYQKKLSGKGNEKIVQELNKSDELWKPSKSKTNKNGGWQKSTVTKILSNRQLLGEYQLHKMIDGKRKETGEVIKDYFPKAIDENLFYQVQELIVCHKNTAGNSGGKTGKARNVFAHVVKCGFCGGAMHFIDKGTLPKGGQYLHCDNSRRKKEDQCTAKPVRYDEFETLFFDNVEELDINNIIPKEIDSEKRIHEIEKKFRNNKGQISNLDNQINRLEQHFINLEKTEDVRSLLRLRNSAEKEKEELEKVNIELTKEKEQLTNQFRELQNNLEAYKEIQQLLNSDIDEQEKINVRLKLRQEIFRLIEWIKIYPLRSKEEKLADLKTKYEKASDLIKAMKNENAEIPLGLKMKINSLTQHINQIETNDAKPEFVVKIRSKYIEKVRIKFNGSGNLLLLGLKTYEEIH